MKADAMSSPASKAKNGRNSKLRCLDLSFEGKDIVFKNGELDNGRLPHGGYKGSKKHPLGLYSFDKGREYQRQLKEDLDHMLEEDLLEVQGSPTWSLEAHRQHTHSGESPLLQNKFLSSSRHESANGTAMYHRESNPLRRSAPPATNGVMYYRPNRLHQYLTTTELRDAADCLDMVKYGRPTRATLLRARLRETPASNAYEVRRQIEHRMEEIRNGSIFSNPKEFVHLQQDVEGESIHSFITGARYNRAHCLDGKSLDLYGVYMPRNNPLGCFVIGQKMETLETTSAPPDSPRSDSADKTHQPPTKAERRRPTTAPGYGQRRKPPSPRAFRPRPAWGDASSALHITNGLNAPKDAEQELQPDPLGGSAATEEAKTLSHKLNLKGRIMPLNFTREGPLRFESRLPSVHGTSLYKLVRLQPRDPAEENSESNQPPPSPVVTSAHLDAVLNLHLQPLQLPVLKQEPETSTDRNSGGKPDLDVAPKPEQRELAVSQEQLLRAEERQGEDNQGRPSEEQKAKEEARGGEGEVGRQETRLREDERDSEPHAGRDTVAGAAQAAQGLTNNNNSSSSTAAELTAAFLVSKTEAETSAVANQTSDRRMEREGEGGADWVQQEAGAEDSPPEETAVSQPPQPALGQNVTFFITEDDVVSKPIGAAVDDVGPRAEEGTEAAAAGGQKVEEAADERVSSAGSRKSIGKKSVAFDLPDPEDLPPDDEQSEIAPGAENNHRLAEEPEAEIEDDRPLAELEEHEAATEYDHWLAEEPAEVTDHDQPIAEEPEAVADRSAGDHSDEGTVPSREDLEPEQAAVQRARVSKPFTVVVTHIERSMGAPAPKIEKAEED